MLSCYYTMTTQMIACSQFICFQFTWWIQTMTKKNNENINKTNNWNHDKFGDQKWVARHKTLKHRLRPTALLKRRLQCATVSWRDNKKSFQSRPCIRCIKKERAVRLKTHRFKHRCRFLERVAWKSTPIFGVENGCRFSTACGFNLTFGIQQRRRQRVTYYRS